MTYAGFVTSHGNLGCKYACPATNYEIINTWRRGVNKIRISPIPDIISQRSYEQKYHMVYNARFDIH
jgi:hypothetical protein